MLTDWAAIH